MRLLDLLVISIVVTAVLGAGTLVGAVLGGVDPTFPPPREVDVRVLVRGTWSDWQEPERFVIRDETTYRAVLGDDAPPVDFSRSTVLGAALGERPTGGHDIRFASVETIAGTMWVRLESVRPTDGCAVTQALTQPYEFVEVERFDGPVLFREPVERTAC